MFSLSMSNIFSGPWKLDVLIAFAFTSRKFWDTLCFEVISLAEGYGFKLR